MIAVSSAAFALSLKKPLGLPIESGLASPGWFFSAILTRYVRPPLGPDGICRLSERIGMLGYHHHKIGHGP